jgi:choline kinase
MKIIILAAGRGTRLGPLTKNTPKSLLDLGNGQTVLEKQLEEMGKSGVIDEIVLVIGYLAEQIEAKIKGHKSEDYRIHTLFNPFYDVSNNLHTLWMAKHYMSGDFLIQNGDNLFTNDVYTDLVSKNKDGIFVTTNVKAKYDDDDMKVTIHRGHIENVSKNISNEQATAESLGLAMISGKKYRTIFRDHLEMLARDRTYMDKFWLEVFNSMNSKGVEIMPSDVDAKEKWREIDIHLDLEEAKRLMGLNP